MSKIPTWTASALWLATVLAAIGLIYWPGAEHLARSTAANLLIAAALLGASVLLTTVEWRRRRSLRLAVASQPGRSGQQG
jgi:hypothetical protein